MSFPHLEFVVVEWGREFSRKAARCKARRRPPAEIVRPAVVEPAGGRHRADLADAAGLQPPRLWRLRGPEPLGLQRRRLSARGEDRSIAIATRRGSGEFAVVVLSPAAQIGRFAAEPGSGVRAQPQHQLLNRGSLRPLAGFWRATATRCHGDAHERAAMWPTKARTTTSRGFRWGSSELAGELPQPSECF